MRKGRGGQDCPSNLLYQGHLPLENATGDASYCSLETAVNHPQKMRSREGKGKAFLF